MGWPSGARRGSLGDGAPGVRGSAVGDFALVADELGVTDIAEGPEKSRQRSECVHIKACRGRRWFAERRVGGEGGGGEGGEGDAKADVLRIFAGCRLHVLCTELAH